MLRQSDLAHSPAALEAADAWAQAFFDRHDTPAMAFAAARRGGLGWSAALGMANIGANTLLCTPTAFSRQRQVELATRLQG